MPYTTDIRNSGRQGTATTVNPNAGPTQPATSRPAGEPRYYNTVNHGPQPGGSPAGATGPDGTPLPDWTPDLSRYPTGTAPQGGILYDTGGFNLNDHMLGVAGGPGANPDGTRVDYSQLGPYTRQVGDEETVRSQMEGLLAADSSYMQQARQAGERAAASRGALSSSMFAGSSQSAAIQSALPIAAQDAQTYSRVASENAMAINNNTLSKMQSLTSIAQSNIAANAQITSAGISAGATVAAAGISAGAQIETSKIAANVNTEIARMRVQSEADARAFMATHDQVMSSIQHGQNIDLANLDYGFRRRLLEAGFMHDANMQGALFGHQVGMQGAGFRHDSAMQRAGFQHQINFSMLNHDQQQQIMNMAHEYGLETIGYQGNINSYLQDRQLQVGFLQSGMNMIFSSLNSINQMGLDGPAYNTAVQNVYKTYGDFLNIFNGLIGGGSGGFNFNFNQPPQGGGDFTTPTPP